MKKRLSLFLLLFVSVLTNSAQLSAETINSENQQATNPETILVLGDSLSAGYNIPLDKGWVNLLRQKIQANNPQTTVINASVSGDTTGQGLARLKPLLAKHKPSLVILELGGNDGLRGISPTVIKRNLATMITISQQSGAKVLLLGMKILPNYGKRYTAAFQQNYLDLAKEKQTELVTFFLDGVAGKQELMQKDGIHPSQQAQPILMRNVLPFIEKLTKQ